MPTSKFNRILVVASALILILLVVYALLRNSAEPISVQEASKLLHAKKVKEVVLADDIYYLKTKKHLYKVPARLVTPAMIANYKVRTNTGSKIILSLVWFVLFIGVVSIFIRWWMKKKESDSSHQVKKISSKKESFSEPGCDVSEPIQAIETDVRFEDIGGIEDVKEELQEIIDFLKNPLKYKNFGVRLPRGVLLVGPPGVGKTMIAKAVANAAKVSFYYQSGASFVQIYVGMGAKRVHELFAAAKKNAPAIIFIDEIDAVGKKRDGNRNDEREATLNQLLTEMDGFESQSGVIVMAATNKIDVLDEALLRAGRFDRRIFVDLPTKKEREEILKKYLRHIPHEVDVEKIADITVGFSGATLAAFVNEAALFALRANESRVTMEHFLAVKDKVVFGKKKLPVLTPKQKEHRVTYQSGKVLVATHFDLPFEKILLSNERLTPPGESEPLLQSELEKKVKTLLAGVVLCDMRYGEHPTSAKEDLDEVKKLVEAMVMEYGMGSALVAPQQEMADIIGRLYSETETLLEMYMQAAEEIMKQLERKESISKNEVRKILDAVL